MSKKINVSPIIYNNGDIIKTIKIDLKEVVKMIDVKGIKDTKLNELILKDDELVNNILVDRLLTNPFL